MIKLVCKMCLECENDFHCNGRFYISEGEKEHIEYENGENYHCRDFYPALESWGGGGGYSSMLE